MFLNALFNNPSQPVFLLFKVGMLIVIGMLTIFLLIALKQIQSMNEIVTQHENIWWIRATAFTLLIATLILFLVTVVIL